MYLKTAIPLLALTASGAFAAGSHGGGHGHEHGEGHDHSGMMAIGKPAQPGTADRIVKVTMSETDDGRMLFEPDTLSFEQGETVRFEITNAGALEHEFVMDTRANNEKHRALMAKFPEMEHDDPNAVRLAPGESDRIVWTFANAGEFHFACLIPGHMESGMHGPITVEDKSDIARN